MLAVTLSKNARARAVQLPAWNEALGLPRPWDQQWSLRMQQILAIETDLLEYDDLFDGNPAVEAKVEALKAAAREELATIEGLGGAVGAIEYMKGRLVASNAERLGRVERGETTVVGVNRYTEAEPSPLTSGNDRILVVDPEVEQDQIASLQAWRESRDELGVQRALKALRAAAQAGENIMPASIAAAKAGVTTGEWADAMRAGYGEYRGPTGVGSAVSNAAEGLDEIRAEIAARARARGGQIRLLIGKPGLDGHSNGAEQIAVRARDCGMAVLYDGIRLTPEAIVDRALAEKVHVIGLSILSGSHLPLVEEVMRRLADAGRDIPVIVGGIIPEPDAERLRARGVAGVYTPKDFDLNRLMRDIADLACGRPAAVAE